jgi:RimJ/RimL family protein N-acetyltransferase
VTPAVVGSVLYGMDEEVSEFVSQRVPQMQGVRFVHPYWAIGVVRNGGLIGGVVFHNPRYSLDGNMVDVEMGAAFEASDWCRPSTLRRMFEFPFVTLDSSRMTTITARKNKRARMIDEGLGFKLEGVHPEAIDGKQDAVSYGMLRKNCLWIDPARRPEAIENLRRVRAQWKKD